MNLQCPKNKEDFQQHMKDKILTWAPFALHIGEDFAVFEFNWPYQMNNAINNVVTRAASGVWGFTSLGKINRYMDDFGYRPHRFGAGVGAAGEVPGRIDGAGSDILAKASTHAKENLPERVLSSVEKFAPFTKASAAVEGEGTVGPEAMSARGSPSTSVNATA